MQNEFKAITIRANDFINIANKISTEDNKVHCALTRKLECTSGLVATVRYLEKRAKKQSL